MAVPDRRQCLLEPSEAEVTPSERRHIEMMASGLHRKARKMAVASPRWAAPSDVFLHKVTA